VGTLAEAVAMVLHLAADDDTVAAGLLLLVDVLVLGAALVRLVGELAACTSAVELDAVTLACDSVALACAAGATRADAGWRGAAGRARRGERGNVGVGIRVGVRVLLGVGVDVLASKVAVELLEGGLVVLSVDDLACLTGALGLGGNDAAGGDTTTFGDVLRSATGLAGGLGGSGSGLGRDVDDVQLAAGGGLGGVVLGGVVGNMVAVDDVVVPVALALLECGTLKLEATDPTTGLLGVLGERKLTLVTVPGTEKVDSLAVGGSAESEVKLDSGHCD
jgi:hypothetical protein